MKWIGLGIGSWVVVYYTAFHNPGWFNRFDYSSLQSPVDRLIHTIKLGALPSIYVTCLVVRLSRLIDTPTAANPLAGGESETWKKYQKILSNTIEQTAAFYPALLALSVMLPSSTPFNVSPYSIVPFLMFSWMTGRILFWIGYLFPHKIFVYRVPGFVWNACSTFCVFGCLAKNYFSGRY